MSIGFSPHYPKYARDHQRTGKTIPAHSPQPKSETMEMMLADGDRTEGLPPETLFEAALLSDNRPLSPYEIAQKLSRRWAPPPSSSPLTDKTI